jgi:hypothetical protein
MTQLQVATNLHSYMPISLIIIYLCCQANRDKGIMNYKSTNTKQTMPREGQRWILCTGELISTAIDPPPLRLFAVREYGPAPVGCIFGILPSSRGMYPV